MGPVARGSGSPAIPGRPERRGVVRCWWSLLTSLWGPFQWGGVPFANGVRRIYERGSSRMNEEPAEVRQRRVAIWEQARSSNSSGPDNCSRKHPASEPVCHPWPRTMSGQLLTSRILVRPESRRLPHALGTGATASARAPAKSSGRTRRTPLPDQSPIQDRELPRRNLVHLSDHCERLTHDARTNDHGSNSNPVDRSGAQIVKHPVKAGTAYPGA